MVAPPIQSWSLPTPVTIAKPDILELSRATFFVPLPSIKSTPPLTTLLLRRTNVSGPPPLLPTTKRASPICARKYRCQTPPGLGDAPDAVWPTKLESMICRVSVDLAAVENGQAPRHL